MSVNARVSEYGLGCSLVQKSGFYSDPGKLIRSSLKVAQTRSRITLRRHFRQLSTRRNINNIFILYMKKSFDGKSFIYIYISRSKPIQYWKLPRLFPSSSSIFPHNRYARGVSNNFFAYFKHDPNALFKRRYLR